MVTAAMCALIMVEFFKNSCSNFYKNIRVHRGHAEKYI